MERLFKTLSLLFATVLFFSCSNEDEVFQESLPVNVEDAEEQGPAGAFKTRLAGTEIWAIVDDTTSIAWYYRTERESFYEKLTKLNAKVRNDDADDPFYMNPMDSVMKIEVTVNYKVLGEMKEVAYASPFIYKIPTTDPTAHRGFSQSDLRHTIYCRPNSAEQEEAIRKFAVEKRMKDYGMQTWGQESAYVLMCWKETDGFILDLVSELNKLGVVAYIPGVLRLDEYIPWKELTTGKLY